MARILPSVAGGRAVSVSDSPWDLLPHRINLSIVVHCKCNWPVRSPNDSKY